MNPLQSTTRSHIQSRHPRSRTLGDWVSWNEASRCPRCLVNDRRWKELQDDQKQTQACRMEKIRTLFKEVLHHQRKRPGCGGCAHRHLSEISGSLIRYQSIYKKLIASVEGSYVRVLAQNAATPFSQHSLPGYNPNYFLKDTLYVISQLPFLEKNERIATFKHQLFQSVAISRMVEDRQMATSSSLTLREPSRSASTAYEDRDKVNLGVESFSSGPSISAYLANWMKFGKTQNLWIPVTTFQPQSKSYHTLIIALERLPENRVEIKIVNIGLDARLNQKDQVCDWVITKTFDETLVMQLSDLVSIYRTNEEFYTLIQRFWPGQISLGKVRHAIYRPLCSTQTLRRLYREFLGHSLYETLMQEWTILELERLQSIHRQLGTLSKAPLTFSISVDSLNGPAHLQTHPQRLSESGYQRQMEGLVMTYLDRLAQTHPTRIIPFSRLPLVIRQHLHGGELVEDPLQEKPTSHPWYLVLPKR